MKILVIHNLGIEESIQSLLESSGGEIIEATDSDSAMNILKERNGREINIVIADWDILCPSGIYRLINYIRGFLPGRKIWVTYSPGEDASSKKGPDIANRLKTLNVDRYCILPRAELIPRLKEEITLSQKSANNS